MSGMPGEVDEQPARRSAVTMLLVIMIRVVDRDRDDSHNNTMAMAMKIMRTWWYPTKGKNLLHPVANRTAMAALCPSRLHFYPPLEPVRKDG